MMDSLGSKVGRLRVGTRLLAAGLAVAALAGCAPAAPDLDSKTGTELQAQVLAVSTAAANEDPSTGLRILDELAEHLTRAAANGDVSFKRHQSIMKAIDAVRADLRAAVTAKAAASTAAAKKAAASKAAADKAAAAKAAAEAAAEAAAAQNATAQNAAAHQAPAALTPQPAVTTQPATDNRAKGSNKGKGKKGG
ncbi:hypothetical protein SRABI83_02085 [Arthrobacter sp. Bi83]|uniref:mucin-associated surface protein n=1 Tax=Arthrobacter sp. Bi83 TaxID=2822353 RepID=UPI001DCEB582|nr:mucin-associated surface protein [Arthrobacter sp. Bi83]CAH0208674.1 hypothetical protein SRABI83_02085 [Arthrobacter sp. Bi83]